MALVMISSAGRDFTQACVRASCCPSACFVTWPAAVDCVPAAAGASLAVASNKFQSGTEHLVHAFFGDIPFVAVLGNRDGCPLKPDPEIVGEVLRRLAVGPEEAVMVGDSGTDMKTARNGGIDAIAVSWGYRPMGPSDDYRFAKNVNELRSMLLC